MNTDWLERQAKCSIVGLWSNVEGVTDNIIYFDIFYDILAKSMQKEVWLV